MSKTRYAISWLYGEFRIARFQRNEIDAQWESPTPVETRNDLVRALDAAAEQIDLSQKGDVTIVHEHDLHTHDYLEVPSMKRRDLEKYLQRRVEKDKSFPEDAEWCYHKVSHQDHKEGVLLHLLPKRIVQSTVATCTAVGLAPKSYVPLTEIVSEYLPSTDVNDNDLILVVACFDARTEMIIALGDGEALFVRELNYGLSDTTVERFVSDVNRTIRYARQQMHRKVEFASFMGRSELISEHSLQDKIEVPLRFEEPSADPYFWARWSMRLGSKLSANFISVFAQNNITADSIRRVAAWSTAVVVVVAVVLTLFTSGLVAHRAEQKRSIEAHSTEIRNVINRVETKLSLGRSKVDHLGRLQATSKNLPSLMMVHLGGMTPQEVTLTEASVERSASGWHFSLQGTVAGDMRQGARTLARFEHQLSGPPWHVQLTQSFTGTWMQQFEQGKLDDNAQLGFQLAGNVQ